MECEVKVTCDRGHVAFWIDLVRIRDVAQRFDKAAPLACEGSIWFLRRPITIPQVTHCCNY
jgi:hypothetical protein